MATSSKRGKSNSSSRRSERSSSNARRASASSQPARFRSVPGGLADRPVSPAKRSSSLSSFEGAQAPRGSKKSLLSGAYSGNGESRREERRSQAGRPSARSASRDARRSSDGRSRQNAPKALRLPTLTPRQTKIAIVLVVVLAFGFLIYPAARDCYIASRDLEKATIELAEVTERNEEVQANIDRLSTDEGIEDYVREQYGWIKVGENSTMVKGLPADSSTTSLASEVESDDIEPEKSWATGILDLIFFVGD